ncbi:DNA ligase D [Cereibacter sp. SYSU M97828]|nr:DNA ligase D [Cereibacter flavus]
MSLETYNAKRDFTATPEPKGKRARKKGASFTIQKHHATRLHYDLRLELDGVLKSWAVTKGPSLDPSQKRLSVQVEDHPLDYGTFEGEIPKGHYGAGKVILWDRGTWEPVHDPHKGLEKGHLEFALSGVKLHGRWHLIRMKDGKNWLLVKGDDEFAATDDILKIQPDSIKARAKMPDFVPPQLATLAKAPPTGDEWLHEIKFDGYRLQARVEDGVRLLTRAGLDWTHRFAPVADALAGIGHTALIDGEVVVERAHGASDFGALQSDLSEGRSDRFVFYAFDLLHLDGRDLRKEPLKDRKAALKGILPKKGILRYSEDFADSGALVLDHACRLGLEGVISKQSDAPYRSGRGRTWIKSKCAARQEFVIAGYVPSTANARAVGSLLLGVFEEGGLRHVGRVGTGFTAKVATVLFKRLEGMQADSPYAEKLTAAERRGAVFVRPELVAEVEFRAWTSDGNLRHAAFRGLREDKPAPEIARERPAARSFALSNPDRVYWPDVGVTKAGLADYYADIWPRIAPFVTGRPLALLRSPNGVGGKSFFQKHAWKGMSDKVRRIRDAKNPGEEPLVGIDDLDGLLALVQSGVLEIHPWGATAKAMERPDMIVMDLDPGDGANWPLILEAATEVRERMAAAGLTGFVKTSGGKGLHVVAPLVPKAGWAAVKSFTRRMAQEMAADSPDRFVATITKSKRKGKVLIDYLRNQRNATAVCAYSTRARPGAPVSCPVAWEELPEIGPAQFTVLNMASRTDDPWDDWRAAAISLQGSASTRP